MYGHETTTSLLAGIGNKTGYNLEFKEGKFIIQPSLFLGYTFVKTFDYTNAAGVRIDSDPAHTFQISPGVKFIGNLKHGWQPYIGVNMVWNVLNNSHVKANSVNLPQMSVKPYIQYGIGLQKTVKDNFVAYGQAMVQNGGRNGISLTAGFRWAIGKGSKPVEKVQKPSNEQKVSNKKIIKQKVYNKTTDTKRQN
jgi:outer membrane autotransporter protein